MKTNKEIIEALVVKAEQAVEDKPWRFGLITAKGDLETIIYNGMLLI